MIKPHSRACNHHQNYHLTCDQMAELERLASGRCQLCGGPPSWRLEDARLVIDHDHAVGYGAVRGLVCISCNGRLRIVDAGKRAASPDEARYLERAWYLRAGHDTNCPPDCGYALTHRGVAHLDARTPLYDVDDLATLPSPGRGAHLRRRAR